MANNTTSAGMPVALIQQVFGQSLAQAYPNTGGPAQNLDLLQIVNEGGNILLNVDSTGVVRNPAVNPTKSAGGIGNTRLGQFQVFLTGSPTTAQLFAAAFTNLALLDIFQVINIGGGVSYWLDYLGVAHGS